MWVFQQYNYRITFQYIHVYEIKVCLNFFQSELKADFRNLRKHVEENGLLKVNPWFYILHLSHIILLEVLAYCVVWYLDGSLSSFLIASCLWTIAQVHTCILSLFSILLEMCKYFYFCTTCIK